MSPRPEHGSEARNDASASSRSAFRRLLSRSSGSGAPTEEPNQTSRRAGIASVASTVGLVVLAVLAPPAGADLVPTGTFSGFGFGDGDLFEPQQTALEQSTGNIFVADSGLIKVFSPSGETASPLTVFGAGTLSGVSGLAVSQSGGQTSVYATSISNGGEIVKFESDEAATPSFTVDPSFTSPVQGGAAGEIGSFSRPRLAVAPNGDLWVADPGNGALKRFDSTGAHVNGSNIDGSSSGTAFQGLIDVAVDSTGDVIAIDTSGATLDGLVGSGASRVLRFAADGTYGAEIGPISGGAGSLAVDPDDDSLLVAGNFNSYYNSANLTLSLFGADNSFVESAELPPSTVYGVVPGLAAASGSNKYIAVTSAYFGFGETGGRVVRQLSLPAAAIAPVNPAGITATTVDVSGSANPNGLQADASFEYRLAGASAWQQSPSQDVGAGASDVPITATLSDLEPNRTYDVRVAVTNTDGSQTSATEQFTTDQAAPAAQIIGVSPKSSTTARLNGRVRPFGLPTTYYFEYSAAADLSGAQRSSVDPDGSAGAGRVWRAVAANLAGLSPATEYFFRLVAENAAGETSTATQSFTTAGADSAARVNEMVSPAEKNGNGVNRGIARASVDGGGVAYTATGAFADAQSSTYESTYVASRGPGGWESRAVMAPTYTDYLAGQMAGQAAADLTSVAVSGRNLPGSTGKYGDLFRWDVETDGFTLMTERRPGAESTNVFYGIGNSDLSSFTMTSEGQLIDGQSHTGGRSLYESYVGSGGEQQLRMISGDANIGAGGDQLGNAAGAVTDDGRIYYVTPGNGNGMQNGDLFMAVDGVTTAEISQSQLATPEAGEGAVFVEGSMGGARVLFASPERLVEASNADGGPFSQASGNEDWGDMYMYETATGELTTLSSSAPSGGRTMGYLGASADLGVVYFVDRAVLAPGATDGDANLYVATSDGEADFVAALDPADTDTWRHAQRFRAAKVAADGSAVVFESRAEFGGAELNGNVGVYVYDREEDAITCVSCDRLTGETNESGSLLDRQFANAPEYRPNAITEDGSFAFFTTREKLAPTDTNGVRDVYQWEAAADSITLISSGTDNRPSYFLDASPDGRDVFFTTSEQLSRWDGDRLADVYDARIGGGVPEPPIVQPPCAGDECKPPPSRPPEEEDPETPTGGGGNPVPTDCSALEAKADRLGIKAKRLSKKAKAASGKRAKKLRRRADKAKVKTRNAKQALAKCQGEQS